MRRDEALRIEIDLPRLRTLAEDGLPWIRKFLDREKERDEQRMRRLQATCRPEILQDLPIDCQKEEPDQNQLAYCCFRHIVEDTWFAGVEIAITHVLNPRNNPPEQIRRWLLQIAEWKDRTEWEPKDFEALSGGLRWAGHALTTELLCFLNPQRYCVWNKRLNDFVAFLRKTRILVDAPTRLGEGERYRFYHLLLDEVRRVLDQVDQDGVFERPINYYHADRLVWYVSERTSKVWLVATGEGGHLWEDFRKSGCIGISWKEASRQIPDRDLTRLREEELKSLFQQVYPGEDKAGWRQVRTFRGDDLYKDMQPGEIVVARKGKNTIVGIGVIRSEVLPPLDPDNPFASRTETDPLHIRWVDWRILEPLEFLNLPQQTITKMDQEQWDALVESYQNQGIDVYARLLPPTTPPTLPLDAYLRSRGYQFEDSQIAAFYAAVKTKGFVILSGLSGTGKTKLALHFAELLCPECRGTPQMPQDRSRCTHLFLSVRPDWRDEKALLGYFNPLTERYESTPLVRLILRAIDDYTTNPAQAQPYFIILDEMNLSHVEYYFADFLSVLESGRQENGFTREPIRLYPPDLPARSTIERDQGIPPEVYLPPNLYIVGTVNVDETTYTFSPKVLDRAFTLEFWDVNLRGYPLRGSGYPDDEATVWLRDRLRADLADGGRFCTAVADKRAISEAIRSLGDAWQRLQDLNDHLAPYDLHFGFRVVDEMALFVRNATRTPEGVKSLSLDEALDLAVFMKVLPKFHGPRQRLEPPLLEVVRWCLKPEVPSQERPDWKTLLASIRGTEASGTVSELAEVLGNWTGFREKFRFPHTARKALRMLRQLMETGFAAFAG